MRKSIKTPVQVPAQELEIPVNMIVGEDDNNGWTNGGQRRTFIEQREYVDVQQRSSNGNGNIGLAAIVAIVAIVALIGLGFWLAFGSVKDEVRSAKTDVISAVNGSTTAINAHSDFNATAINANTDSAGRALLTQMNVNDGAIRGDIAGVKNSVENEGSKTRRSIWSANKATAAAITAAKPDLTGLASKADLNGLATKGDVDAAGDKLQKWMATNQAKVTVTPAAASAAPVPAAAPAPAPAPGAPVK